MSFIVAMVLGGVAQVQEEGLLVVNGGWTVREPEPEGVAAIGLLIAVPRERGGKELDVRLSLLDHATGDEFPVIPIDEDGIEMGEPAAIRIEGSVLVEGLKDPRVTIPLMAKLAVTLPPFRLPPGREFRWQLYLDGETRPEWATHFRTTPPEPAQQQ